MRESLPLPWFPVPEGLRDSLEKQKDPYILLIKISDVLPIGKRPWSVFMIRAPTVLHWVFLIIALYS